MKTILVIVEDEEFRKSITTALGGQGYEVLDTKDGATGLTMALAQSPDLILSDVKLPGVSGLDLLKELRGRPETRAIPVILMTGEKEKVSARLSLDEGADDFLAKPFTGEELLAAVRARLLREERVHHAGQVKRLAARVSGRERLPQAAGEDGVVRQMTAKGFRNILQVVVLVFIFALLQMFVLQRVCNEGMKAAKSLEYQGLPNLDHLAALQEQLVLFRLYSYEYMFALEAEKPQLAASIQIAKSRIEAELTGIKGLLKDVQGQQLATALELSFTALGEKFDQTQSLVDKDFSAAMNIMDKDIPPRIKAVNEAAEKLHSYGYQFSRAQADADFDSFVGIKNKTVFFGVANIIVAFGLVIFVLLAASRTRKQLVSALEQLRWKTAFLEAQVTSSMDGVLVVNEQGTTILQNQRMINFFKIPQHLVEESAAAAQRQWIADMTTDPGQFMKKILQLDTQRNEIVCDEVELKDGTILDLYSSPVIDKNGKYYGRIWTFRDITERKRAEAERQAMELQLRQSQKLESVGQLAAGIAHEINTPTQYVGDNTRFVKDSFASIFNVLRSHEALLAAVKSNAVTPELLVEQEQILATSDLEYLCTQIPTALDETLEGVDRVSKIVRAMKEFSHPGSKQREAADLNRAIESTVTVAHNEWKYVAEVKLELDPNLPLVPCFLGEFNQCMLNLIVNAAHAIGDAVKSKPDTKGIITVQTRHDGDHVEIRVGDTGTGIPEAVQPKLFEPFFTTKGVGKGTGQGLSIIYGSIVKHHGGTVKFETKVGQGTVFIIRLPLKNQDRPKANPQSTWAN